MEIFTQEIAASYRLTVSASEKLVFVLTIWRHVVTIGTKVGDVVASIDGKRANGVSRIGNGSPRISGLVISSYFFFFFFFIIFFSKKGIASRSNSKQTR